MSRRITGAILRLYPRRVREGHGPEIAMLVDDLITHEQHARACVLTRLAVDGLVQRAASTATARMMLAVLTAASFGGLAVSDFAAASAHPGVPQARQAVKQATHPRRTPARPARSRRTSHRPPAIVRPPISVRFPPRR